MVDGSMIDCLLDKMTGVFPHKSSRMLLYQTKSAVQTVHNCTGVMRALREEEIDSRLQAQTKRSLGGIVWSPYKGHFTPKMEITDEMLPVFDKVNRRLEEADVPARWRAVVRRRGNRIEVMELVVLCTEIRLLEHDVLEASVPPRDHFVINGFGFTPKMLPVFRETNDMFAAAGFPHFVSVSCVNFMDVNQDPECYAADNEWNEEADGEGEELDGEKECAGADSADIAYTLSSMKTELAIVSTALDMLLIRSSSEIMEKIIHIAKKAVETASDCVKEIEAAQLGEES